jgi:F-type H+-transporting ATPase subunit gamma
MASAREMRLRIRSVKNIAQVTRALQAVSASKVRKAVQAVSTTRPYAEQAWKILKHLSEQPGHASLHPMLKPRDNVKNILVVMISSDRGTAGAYNTNILHKTLVTFKNTPQPVSYVAVGKKGRDLLVRRGKKVVADFSNLPVAPSFMDVSAIGRLAVDGYLAGTYDEVYLAYTNFVNMVKQVPEIRRLLPLEVDTHENIDELVEKKTTSAVYTYEPDQMELLDQIIPRFTALQVYQAILESTASEHAARMVAMRNATENANDLVDALSLEYNKVRQQSITNDMLDIAGGAEALAKATQPAD